MTARILVVGDALADVYVESSVRRISPEAPVPVVLREASGRVCPGGALNVAANAAALGAEVSVVAVVGDDAEAGTLRAELTARGLDVAALVVGAGIRTITKTRFIVRGRQIVRVDEERGPDHYRPFAYAAAQAVEDALAGRRWDVVLVSDYGKGTVTPDLVARLRRSMAAGGPRIIVDPAGRDVGRYRGLWGLKVNRGEAEALLGRELPDRDAIDQGAKELLDAGFEAIWITLGALGSHSLSRAEGPCRHASEERSVYDVTGAGDTFLAALGVALAEGRSVRDATGFANAASGVAVGEVGTTVVHRHQIEAARRGAASWDARCLSADQAAEVAERCRAVARRIGFTNGCFDLLHPGHLDSLEWAARRVDVLFVGLNTDESVRRAKGAGRPVQTCRDRARLLLALRAVDYVVPFGEDTPEALIRRIRPHALFKGEEWAHFVAGREFVESYGGRVELVPRTPGYSTTTLLRSQRDDGDRAVPGA
jgi:D-beta-D-heptose 7-phosphate kinase/D-beta-D-heptose 1-phosphate adenosyltransferase